MDGLLAPAVLVALLGIVIQGVNAGAQFYDWARSREARKREESIALCVALMGLADAMGRSDGERVVLKRLLMERFLARILPEDVLTSMRQ